MPITRGGRRAAPCGALLLALAIGCAPAGRDARDDTVRVPVPADRRPIAGRWDTVWTYVADERDTLVTYPIALAIGPRHVFVLDGGSRRLAALARESGRLVWSAGPAGAADATPFERPTALALTPEGRPIVADVDARRLVRFDERGGVVDGHPLPSPPDATSLCPLADGGVLLTLNRRDQPIVRLDARGRLAAAYDLPWPELREVSGLAKQARFAAGAGGAGGEACVLALVGGVGFAITDAAMRGRTSPYVEAFPLPGTMTRRTVAPGELVVEERLVGRRMAGVDLAVTPRAISILFLGTTPAAARIVDRYDPRTGDYTGTWLLPRRIGHLAAADDLHAFAFRRRGMPAITLVRFRAGPDPEGPCCAPPR